MQRHSSVLLLRHGRFLSAHAPRCQQLLHLAWKRKAIRRSVPQNSLWIRFLALGDRPLQTLGFTSRGLCNTSSRQIRAVLRVQFEWQFFRVMLKDNLKRLRFQVTMSRSIWRLSKRLGKSFGIGARERRQAHQQLHHHPHHRLHLQLLRPFLRRQCRLLHRTSSGAARCGGAARAWLSNAGRT